MHDLPRQKLSELVAKHGHGLCDDARKLEGLLKDVLRNEHKRETFVLISALREGVANELLGSTSGMPPAALAAKLTRQLCDNLVLDDGVARWSVESWALALGVRIAQSPTAPIKLAASVNMTGATPMPGVGVDLAALALQHREKAEHDRVKAAQAEVGAAQMKKEAKANAILVQKEAKRLAEQTRDFAAAARMLEEIDPQWRDGKLYKNIRSYRDKVKTLDAAIQKAVHKGRLQFLRGRVQELLKLQPKRDDMLRLLEVLPDEPEFAHEFTNSIGMKFVLIQPGEFIMGSDAATPQMPLHMVEITLPFYLGVFQVTQREYRVVMGKNPSQFTGNTGLPVENVSWNDAVAFSERLSQLAGGVPNGACFRLATEAEWEYGCRAGSTGQWCFGDNKSSLRDYAWFDENSGKRTHPVGEKKPNAWGLHDMHGNVAEWCLDRYGAYPSGAVTDPQGPTTGSDGVLRGGCWMYPAELCSSAFRARNPPAACGGYGGFRVALSPSVH